MDFNSHAHVERDSNAFISSSETCHFNSHAHVERDSNVLGGYMDSANFNSHAHVERDIVVSDYIDYEDISTHTLTWSVTVVYYNRQEEFEFQLTRSRGA